MPLPTRTRTHVFTALLILILLDGITTTIGLFHTGATELNPYAVFVFNALGTLTGITIITVTDSLATASVFYITDRLSDSHPHITTAVTAATGFITAYYVFVVINNFSVIFTGTAFSPVQYFTAV